MTASWFEVVQSIFKTPRRDLGRLGVVGIVVFLVSSIRRSAVHSVEHLRLRLRTGQSEGERRGNDRAWRVRATRELWGVIARPERARRRLLVVFVQGFSIYLISGHFGRLQGTPSQ